MKNNKDLFLILLCWGMLISIFYTYTSFILTCISQKTIPLSFVIIILLLSTLITYLQESRGWRRIVIIGFHSFGFLFISLWFYHIYYNIAYPFGNIKWIYEFFITKRNFTGWITLFVIFSSTLILWFGGIRLWIKPTDKTTISHRFDLGLALILFLFIIKLIITVKGGKLSAENSSIKYLLTFIIFGLFAIGTVHINKSSQSGIIISIKNISIIIIFIIIIYILARSFFIFSGIQPFANAGYNFLGNIIRLTGNIIITLMHFFWGGHHIRVEQNGNNQPAMPSGAAIRTPSHIAVSIIKYLTILFLLVITIFLLYRLLKLLFSKNIKEKNKKGILQDILLFLSNIKKLFLAFWFIIFSHSKTSCKIEKYYYCLLRWGHISGLEHTVFETPKEYSLRLISIFPNIETEINYIIHMHDKVLYGCIAPDNDQISRTKLNLRKIRSPLLWPLRFRSLFFQNRYESKT